MNNTNRPVLNNAKPVHHEDLPLTMTTREFDMCRWEAIENTRHAIIKKLIENGYVEAAGSLLMQF
jgi:hypothetical protein